MNIEQVPQQQNKTLAGQRKSLYAKNEMGQIISVACKGWEVEEIVTSAAVEQLQQMANEALLRAKAGLVSPLEYWMHTTRMDLPLLAQSTGIWRWRIRRHFRPKIFAKLKPTILQSYAHAMGISIDSLKKLP